MSIVLGKDEGLGDLTFTILVEIVENEILEFGDDCLDGGPVQNGLIQVRRSISDVLVDLLPALHFG